MLHKVVWLDMQKVVGFFTSKFTRESSSGNISKIG